MLPPSGHFKRLFRASHERPRALGQEVERLPADLWLIKKQSIPLNIDLVFTHILTWLIVRGETKRYKKRPD